MSDHAKSNTRVGSPNTTIRVRNKLLLIIAAALCTVSFLPMGWLFMTLFGRLQ